MNNFVKKNQNKNFLNNVNNFVYKIFFKFYLTLIFFFGIYVIFYGTPEQTIIRLLYIYYMFIKRIGKRIGKHLLYVY